MIEVAQRGTGNEQRHQKHTEHGKHAHQPYDDRRRIAQHIAAGAADDDSISADQGERQRTEHQRNNPEQRCLELLA